ncbi:hypothetical protein A0J61_02164 [Choanephora cucurbitarum]|uniref:Uncharacterized protein n=1 Tax=Choanephora cucurbitarum TaxID=101091 RepID=A0A1C7NKX8_9FUNG|nr:hypothetical protein A0J61_02164 [Choanephora cucurbitarum]
MDQPILSSNIKYNTIEALFKSLDDDILILEQPVNTLVSKITEGPLDIWLDEQSSSNFQLADTDTGEKADYIPSEAPSSTELDDIIYISDDEPSSIIFIDSDSEDEVCYLCHVECTSSKAYREKERNLKSKCWLRGKVYCLGCARLLEFPSTDMERREMLSYLITGKIPRHDQPPNLSSNQVLRRLQHRYEIMKARWQFKTSSKSRSFPLAFNDLLQIYHQERQTCQMSGLRCYIHDARYKRVPYWALTLDHITPVSHRWHDRNLWAVGNLQTMSSVLNSVKSDATDNELAGWYKRFLDAHLVVID